MKYMLDTNICIYIIKKQPESVLKKLTNLNQKDVCISSITEAELWYGIYNSQRIEENSLALSEFLRALNILKFDSDASNFYGKIRTELKKKGEIIGAMDLLIAAHAISKKLVLVTNNTKEFKRVKSLSISNWV